MQEFRGVAPVYDPFMTSTAARVLVSGLPSDSVSKIANR
jgi:hypothetical protein